MKLLLFLVLFLVSSHEHALPFPLLLAMGSPIPSSSNTASTLVDKKERVIVSQDVINFVGESIIESNLVFDGTRVGGISGLAYYKRKNVMLALSDDSRAPRFYTLKWNPLENDPIQILDVTFLETKSGTRFPPLVFDAESIVLYENEQASSWGDRLWISSEGNRTILPENVSSVPPTIFEFNISTGRQISNPFPIPSHFVRSTNNDGRRRRRQGIRRNHGFESLALSLDGTTLWTATENSLEQDGPAASTLFSSFSRLLSWKLPTMTTTTTMTNASEVTGSLTDEEFVYVIDRVSPRLSGSGGGSGLNEFIALDHYGTFLSLERSIYKDNDGIRRYHVRLYEIQTPGSVNVRNTTALRGLTISPPVSKRLVVDLDDLGIASLENIEAMTLYSSPSSTSRRDGTINITIVLASDNNFDPLRPTQFLALNLTLLVIGVAEPSMQTPSVIAPSMSRATTIATGNDQDDSSLFPLEKNNNKGTSTSLLRQQRGRAVDAALWLYPLSSTLSTTIVALEEGGLVVYDLEGNMLQHLTSKSHFSCKHVHVLYTFDLTESIWVDLVIAQFVDKSSTQQEISIFSIDVESRCLINITSTSMPALEYNNDNNNNMNLALGGIVTYTCPLTGDSHVYVQHTLDQIVQYKLVPDIATAPETEPAVSLQFVRTIDLPATNNEDDDLNHVGSSFVIDRETGIMYITVGNVLYQTVANLDDNETPTVLTKAPFQWVPTDSTSVGMTTMGLTLLYMGTTTTTTNNKNDENNINGAVSFTGGARSLEKYLVTAQQDRGCFSLLNLESGSFHMFSIGDNRNKTTGIILDSVNMGQGFVGMEILNAPMGDTYPRGLLVVPDASNEPQDVVVTDNGVVENVNTNVKMISWLEIARAANITTTTNNNANENQWDWNDPRSHVVLLRLGLVANEEEEEVLKRNETDME